MSIEASFLVVIQNKMKVIVKRKRIILILGSMLLMLLTSWLISLLLSPRGFYPDAERYEYQVADSLFIDALMKVRDKYPEVFVDSSEKLINDFTSPESDNYYSTLYLRSRGLNVYYCFSFKHRSLDVEMTTLYFYAVIKDGSRKRNFLNRDLDDVETGKYINDFESTMLPLIEAEMKGAKRLD